MSKICFCDIDRVIANGDARFALAESVASASFTQGTRDYNNAYWHVAFTPENVLLDTLLPGAYDALNKIEETHDILFLTSRPEHMREATRAWLQQHHINAGRDLVMKPAPNQYDKTYKWKTWIIHTLAYMYGASEVLVIDDEQNNLDELKHYTTSFSLRCYTSLEMKEPTPDTDDMGTF